MNKTIFEVVRRSKGIELLLLLLSGPKHMKELQDSIGGSITTVDDRVNELLKVVAIKEEKIKKPPFRRIITLTDTGRCAAELLKITSNLFENYKHNNMIWLFALLHKFEIINGRTRLEKLLFLLKNEIGVSLEPFYTFKPEKFGPYSEDIINDIKKLVVLGLVEEQGEIYGINNENSEYIIGWKYKLTSTGQTVSTNIWNNMSNTIQNDINCLRKYNEMPLKELLRYVHDKYPFFKID